MNTIIQSLSELFDPANGTGWSAATDALAKLRPMLDDKIARDRATMTEQFSRLTKDQIIASVAKVGVTLKHMPKDELVAAAVDAWVKAASNEYKELQTLIQDARDDLIVVRRLTDTLEAAEAAKTKLVEALMQSPTPGHIANAMSWKTDDVAVAAAKAKWALTVVREVENGKEIRAAITKVAAYAVESVMELPRRVISNGAGTGHRTEEIAEAVGAADFLRNTVARVAGEQVPTEWFAR